MTGARIASERALEGAGGAHTPAHGNELQRFLKKATDLVVNPDYIVSVEVDFFF